MIDHKQSMWSGRYLLAWVSASMLEIGEALRTTCMSLFILAIAKSWNVSTASVLTYASIMSIVTIFFAPIWGRWIAKYGVKNCVLVSGIATTAVMIGWSMSSGLTSWYILAALMGFVIPGCGSLAATTSASQWFIVKRSTVIGIIIAFLSIGGMAGSAILPSVIVASGWGKAMLVMAIANGVFTIPFAFALNTPDKYGYVPLGFKKDDLAASAAASSMELPGLPASRAFKLPLFYIVWVTMMLVYLPSAFMANLPTWGVLQGFDATRAGLLVTYACLAGVIFTIVVGMFNEKFGVIATTAAFLGGGVLGLLCFLIAKSYLPAVLAAVLLAIGYSYMVAMPSILTVTIFGSRDFSKLYGAISVTATIAGIIAVPGLALIQNTTGSYNLGFWIMGVLWIVAIGAVSYTITRGASAQAEYSAELAKQQAIAAGATD